MKSKIVKDINQKATDAVTAIQNNPNLYEKYEQDYDKFLKTQITANGEKVEDISKLLGIFYFISKLKNNPTITNLDVPIDGGKKISQIDDKLTGSDTTSQLKKVLYKWQAGGKQGTLIDDIRSIDQNTSITICDQIVESAIKENNPESLIAALDVLMFAMYRMSSNNPITQEKKNELIERLVKSYLTKVNQIAIDAIEKQVFSFRKPDGSQFSNAEIVEFYKAETPDDFTLKENLENIKKKVKESLDKFKDKIGEISQNYKVQINGIIAERPGLNNKFISDWKTNVNEGAVLINKLVEDEIILLNKEVETKVTEKSNYLSDLLKEADSYIKAGKQLPTFLLDPADGYTELGLVYDKKAWKDPLFDGQNPVTLLQNLRFDLSEQRYKDQLITAGFQITETGENVFVTDDKGNRIDTGRKYYQLSRSDNDGNKVKEFLGSASGKPRGVPNIYYKNGIDEPQQIYSREFLAVYQKALVEEIKSVAEKSKGNRVQINKCFFFTGEGKTHTIQRITNDIKFKKQADAVLGNHSAEEMIVMDFNLQSDDLEEIKRKIKAEIDKNSGKKLSFVFQADEDPHTSADIKQFFYLDVYDFLTKDCKLGVGVGLGTINTISISGTPKQKRFDHLVDKIVTNYNNDDLSKDNFNKYWFGSANNGKQSKWLDKESGKKEIRTLENLFNAYGNIGELFSSAETDDSKSIEGRISKNLRKVNPLKGGAQHRHIQYLIPDFSANDSALLFAPSRLEGLVQDVLTQSGVTTKEEFFVLLPPIADSVAKEIRDKAGDISSLSESQKNYINFLEKKKIVKFVKIGGQWKMDSVSEGSEEALDPKSNEDKAKYGNPTERDCLSFYDKNTVVGGDYGKYSRDVTDVYIDDLSGREFGTDDLAQWIARNRTMDLRKQDVVKKVKAQCNFHFCGTQESLDRIKQNAANDAQLTKAQFEIVNAKSGEIQSKINAYNTIKKSIKPANDNDLTPLKKITERLNRLGLSELEMDSVIQELDAYADKNKKSILFNRYDENQIADNLFELSIFVHAPGTVINKANQETANLCITANLYAKEYIEQKRVLKPNKDNSVNLNLFTRRVDDTKIQGLSKKLEIFSYKSLEEVKLRDYFSNHELKIGSAFYDINQKKKTLKNKLEIELSETLLPTYTILDVIRLRNEDNYSNSDIKRIIHQKKLDQYLNITLDKTNDSFFEFQKKIKGIEGDLTKETKNKKELRSNENFKNVQVIFESNQFKLKLSDGKEIQLKPNDQQNIFKSANNVLKKQEELERLDKDLASIERNQVVKQDFSAMQQEIADLKGKQGEVGWSDSIKVLKQKFSVFKVDTEKTNNQNALATLPSQFVEKAKSNPEKLKKLANRAQQVKGSFNLDSLPLPSVIGNITITDPDHILFSEDEIKDITNNSKKQGLIDKLSSCLEIRSSTGVFDKTTEMDIVIDVQNMGEVKITHNGVEAKADINTEMRGIAQEKEPTEVLDKHKTELGNFYKKLKSKRSKSDKKENKIGLYYVNQFDVQEDNADPNDKAYQGTIPHLVWEEAKGADSKIVTDIALSKQAYQEELTYLTNTEENLKEYLATGLGSQDEANQVFHDMVYQDNGLFERERDKIGELGGLPLIPLKPGGKNNFANSLERTGTRVKISFMTDYFEPPAKDQIKKLPKNWPEDAPTVRYVQVNGTGIIKGSAPLKLKFGLNKETGNLEYQGIYRYINKTPVPILTGDDITPEEKKSIQQMKALVTWQMPNKSDSKQIILKQAIFFDGSTCNNFISKQTAKNLDQGEVTFKVSDKGKSLLDKVELKIKPSPMAVPLGAARLAEEQSKLKA